MDATKLQFWNATTRTWVEGKYALLSPKDLSVLPALQSFKFLTLMPELNYGEQLSNDPIIVTLDGLVLAGFERWQTARAQNEAEVACVQIKLSADDALVFMLRYHQPRRGWNAFVRIRIALNLEPGLKARALENMWAGGRFKGSPNLAQADCVDVRCEIAKFAACGKANVDKVKTILARAHPNIIAALENGVLTIHKAWQWCNSSLAKQKEFFEQHEEEQNERKVMREFRRSAPRAISDPKDLLVAMEQCQNQNPGSIIFRALGGRKHTLVVLGEDVLLRSLDLDRSKF